METKHVEELVRQAMEEVQRNAVPVIRKLLAEAQPRPAFCTFEDTCESCQ